MQYATAMLLLSCSQTLLSSCLIDFAPTLYRAAFIGVEPTFVKTSGRWLLLKHCVGASCKKHLAAIPVLVLWKLVW